MKTSTKTQDTQTQDYLIEGILNKNSNGLLKGKPESYKTTTVLQIAHALCTGKPFFGHAVSTTGKVIFVSNDDKDELARRVKAIKITEGGFNNNLLIVDQTMHIDDACMDNLRRYVETTQPVLVIFDDLNSLSPYSDTDDDAEVGAILGIIKDTCANVSTLAVLTTNPNPLSVTCF
ncbi:MAG: AAA family ATPase [Methylococcaceae bacterium]